VDLASLMSCSLGMSYFSDEDVKRLGLTGKKKRFWLTVIMCATTRCILGMRLSRTRLDPTNLLKGRPKGRPFFVFAKLGLTGCQWPNVDCEMAKNPAKLLTNRRKPVCCKCSVASFLIGATS